MARLVLCLDGRELAEYNMTKERYTIGRLPDNDIRLDHPGVSGHHALLINVLDDSFLEDLNSTNGTMVNGRRITKHPLQHLDIVRIGRHELRFVDEDEADADADEFERTMVLNTMNDAPNKLGALVNPPADADPATDRNRPAPAAAARTAAREAAGAVAPEEEADHARTLPPDSAARAAAMDVATDRPIAPPPRPAPAKSSAATLPLGKIQVLSGTFAGKELELKKALTTLGRPGIQVAAISRRAEGYFIVHVESGKPGDYPLLNGESTGQQAHPLESGDVIQLAGVKMGFFLV